MEILAASDMAWRLLAKANTINVAEFAAEYHDKLLEVEIDEFGSSDVTHGYKPVVDYSVKLPVVPGGLRGKPTAKTIVQLRWSGNADDKRSTVYCIYRLDPGHNDFMEVGRTIPVIVDAITYKNPTNFTDTIPDTLTAQEYEYYVVAANAIGESAKSDHIKITSLTDAEVYLMGLEEKMSNNLPLTLTEGCILLTWDQDSGAKAASLIAGDHATYDNFRSLGLTFSVCTALSVLAHTTRKDSTVLKEVTSWMMSAK